MTPEMPAKNISKMYSSDNLVSFRVNCVCDHPDHDMYAMLSVEQTPDFEDKYIEVSILVKTENKPKNFREYFTLLWKILTKREIEYSTEILMDAQTTTNFANALTETLVEMENKIAKN